MKRGTFRDLNIWKKGLELIIKVRAVSRLFPKYEKFGLTDQIDRSSNSIIALIAEAHGRYHFADKCRVLYQARGECEETQSHMSVAHALGYIDKITFKTLDKEYEGLGIGINSYILGMKRNKN